MRKEYSSQPVKHSVDAFKLQQPLRLVRSRTLFEDPRDRVLHKIPIKYKPDLILERGMKGGVNGRQNRDQKTQISDLDVIHMIQSSDKSQQNLGLTIIQERYGNQALASARKCLGGVNTDPPEVVNTALLRVFRKSNTFNENRGGLKAWFLTIVRNASRDDVRHEKTRGHGKNIPLDSGNSRGDAPFAEKLEDIKNGDPLDHLLEGENRQTLEAALLHLNSEDQYIVRMYLAEYTNEEMARTLNIPLYVLKSRLQRANVRLVKKAKELTRR